MSKFMYLFRGGAFVTPGLSPSEIQTHLKRWVDWVGSLAKAGHHQQGGHPLQTGGKTLHSAEAVTDGPYAESKDLVTGNLVVEASSIDEAARLARGCPVFEYGGTVEIRPILEREI